MSDKLQETMSNEIKKRLESKDWNLEMAHKVIEKKNAEKSKIFKASFTVAFAAAASIIGLFLFQFVKMSNIDTFDNYINSQVEGTYSFVFGKNGHTDINESIDDMDDVDMLIDDAMDSR